MVRDMLDRARVSTTIVANTMHLLAAAEHRQWIDWQVGVLPDLEQLRGMPLVTARERVAVALEAHLTSNAREVAGIVLRSIGFAYQPNIIDVMQDRKRRQLGGWVEYVLGTPPGEREERWKLQCRTPFLYLPPSMQMSDYHEAATDLVVAADRFGLVLSCEPSVIKPMTMRQQRLARMWHRLGAHGGYRHSPRPYLLTCNGCGHSWGVCPP